MGGVAIAIELFVQRQLQNGSLVSPFKETFCGGEGNFPTWPKTASSSPTLIKFLGWIRQRIEREAA